MRYKKKRDVLCNKVSEVNNNYPATDERSYRAAQKALQKEEEQTFKENELDSILPNGIDKCIIERGELYDTP